MLKTKLFAVGLSVLCLMSFMLSGCNKASGTPTTESTTVTETTPEAKKEGFVFEYNGISLEVDKPAKEFVDKSGLSFNYREMNGACGGVQMFEYYNDSVVIKTLKSGIVTNITLTDDRVKTKEGITIGSTIEQLKAAYGEPQDQTDSTWSFSRDSTVLLCEIEDGKIKSIFCNTAV